MPEYELFTHRGNLLAERLVGGIADGVASGALTRGQAVEAACAAISDIRSIDAGMRDSEPFRAIASELSRAFDPAGMARIDGDELNHAYWGWSRNGGSGRPEADGNRHFDDASWYDPERLAFHDACEALDAVKGQMNTLNYNARMPESSGFPRAVFAGGTDVQGAVSVGVTDDGAVALSLPPGPKEGEAGEAVARLEAAVAAANAAIFRMNGRLVPVVATFDPQRGPQFGVSYRGHAVEAERASFPDLSAQPSLDARRAAALEAISSSFDFGAVVEDMSGWRHDEPGAVYTRRVFVQDAGDPEADSVRGTLTVVFEPWSDTVAEVRASVGGIEVENQSAPEPGL